MKKEIEGNLMLLFAALLWGTAFVFQSVGMNVIGPLTLSATRMTLGGLSLLPVVAAFGRKFNRMSVRAGVVCGLILCVASNLQQFGLVSTSAGKAGFITTLYVVIVPVMSIFLKKRVPGRIWICVAIAVAGFYFLCIKENFTIEKGDFLVLMCSFCFSAHIMAVDHFNGKGADSLIISCVQFLTVGAISTVLMFVFEEPEWASVLQAKWSILYLGIISSGLAYTLQIIGQKRTNPTVGTLSMSMESVFAAVAGWLILNEHMSGKELLGCALVFSAVVLAQLPSKKRNLP